MKNKRIDKTVNLADVDGSWSIIKVGEYIYIGTYLPARLYRYNILTDVLEDIASFEKSKYVWDMEYNGKDIIIGTSPQSQVFIYRTDTDKLISLGSLSDEQYVRSLESYGETIYAGIGARAALLEFNPSTNTMRDILPARYKNENFVYDIKRNGDKLFIGISPSNDIIVYDLKTKEFVSDISDIYSTIGTGLLDPNSLEMTILGVSVQYDEKENKLKKIIRKNFNDHPFLGGLTDSNTKNGESIVGINSLGMYIQISPEGQILEMADLSELGLEPLRSLPMSLVVHNNKAYVGERRLRVYDVQTSNELYKSICGEPKRMCTINGNLITANYTKARVWRFPIKDVLDNEIKDLINVDKYLLLDIKTSQNRPRAIRCDEKTNSILIGTEPDYGTYGGTLTFYSLDTNDFYVEKDIVKDHTICEITYDASNRNIAYLGTFTKGGTGTEFLEEDAHLIKWDIKNRTKVFDSIPENDNNSILSIENIGHVLYIVTGNNSLILLDSSTGKVLKKNDKITLNKLHFTQNGELLGINYTELMLIDQQTMDYTVIKGDFEHLTHITEDLETGILYLVDKFNLISYEY